MTTTFGDLLIDFGCICLLDLTELPNFIFSEGCLFFDVLSLINRILVIFWSLYDGMIVELILCALFVITAWHKISDSDILWFFLKTCVRPISIEYQNVALILTFGAHSFVESLRLMLDWFV